MNIYIKDPSVTQVKRDQRVPVIWFVANIGGILGLSMGCSLVTVFEILHHAVILFFRTGRRSLTSFKADKQKKVIFTNQISSFNFWHLFQGDEDDDEEEEEMECHFGSSSQSNKKRISAVVEESELHDIAQ